MIEVEHLTKRFGRHTAVSDVSFSVARGEIVGLLGPNGAGKSTIMRILSCFMAATSGSVRVAGRDVMGESRAVRRRIGYMPENNPIYTDLRVREYLKFRARLKGLGFRQSRRRADFVIEQCGLAEVTRQMIGTLSKGYRQRVGLADALIHEPELIILDEPTIGLDPHQIRAFRQLIRGLGGAHTVLLSSHILHEVEMTSTRVVILHTGRILVSDTPETLRARMAGGGQVTAEIQAAQPSLEAGLRRLPGLVECELHPLEDGFWQCQLTPRPGVDLRPGLYRLAVDEGWVLRELALRRHSLEDVFVQVTGGVGPEREGWE
ncbi:MAG: ABC transporter ATP-binding protein [Verrucomicrobiales bacterium]|nr:ABC transporter ATP-binding protein [Verrucomicrobiales bacterium]